VESQVKLLCPDITDAEGKADEFMRQGPKTVIITLGHSVCYLKNSFSQGYFPPPPFPPMDTTGAADAFIVAFIGRNSLETYVNRIEPELFKM
jgi:ribokinase